MFVMVKCGILFEVKTGFLNIILLNIDELQLQRVKLDQNASFHILLNPSFTNYFYFVFGRSQVQISASRPAVLIKVCCGFPQSLQVNAEIVP
jgi:hypothetical protein